MDRFWPEMGAHDGSLQVLLLGPIEVRSQDQAWAGEPRLLAVLAALAVDAGRVVTTATLIDRVWGGCPPAQALKTLRSYITRLRRLMEIAESGPRSLAVVKHAGGYRLTAGSAQVDLSRFRTLVERARRTVDPDAKATLLQEAVTLWRGDPLGGATGEWVDCLREQLVGERLMAIAAWSDAQVAVGNGVVVLPQVAAFAITYPLTEPVVAAYVRILVALGRPTEALEYCRNHRQWLAGQYGTDQGPELRQHYADILRGATILQRLPQLSAARAS